jgi:hypothetical protein
MGAGLIASSMRMTSAPRSASSRPVYSPVSADVEDGHAVERCGVKGHVGHHPGRTKIAQVRSGVRTTRLKPQIIRPR